MARVKGLNGTRYLDKTDSNREKAQEGEVAITGETDRVYLNTRGAVELHDPVLRRRLCLAKENSFTTVVWNPWADKAKAMADLGPDEWTQMLCIETSNVLDYAVEVAPGKRHVMKAGIRVAGL